MIDEIGQICQNDEIIKVVLEGLKLRNLMKNTYFMVLQGIMVLQFVALYQSQGL